MTTLEVVISIIAVLEILFFSVLVLFLYLKTDLLPKNNPSPPKISVVVPFKDEDQNLYNLLSSLDKQSYKNEFEVILINDDSSDNYEKEIERTKIDFPNLDINLICSHFNPKINLTGKQQALDNGVKIAKYDYIAFTDADVKVKENWLTTLSIDLIEGKEQLVFGHTAIDNRAGNGILPVIETIQLEFLFAVAYLFNKAGLVGSCMGNNFLITKNLYNKVGGQSGIGYSVTEDRELLKRTVDLNAEVTTAYPFHPTVISQPSKSLTTFIDQSLRWIKGGLKGFSSLYLVLLTVAIANISFILSVLGFIGAPYSYFQITASLFMIIIIMDTMYKNNSPKIALLFPIYYLFFVAETPIIAILLLFRKPQWKGRKI